MNQTFIRLLILYIWLLSCAAVRVGAQGHGTPAPGDVEHQLDLYAPYAFLIGEWDVKAESDGPTVAVQRVRWGPNKSYMWYAVTLLSEGREEPHLEGMLMWNGLHQNLDMLFALDLKSGRIQEQGSLSVAPGGGVVREITAVYSVGIHTNTGETIGPAGGTAHFRQTYKQISPDRIETSVMRETKNGWVATFPGSDRLIMTRRSG